MKKVFRSLIIGLISAFIPVSVGFILLTDFNACNSLKSSLIKEKEEIVSSSSEYNDEDIKRAIRNQCGILSGMYGDALVKVYNNPIRMQNPITHEYYHFSSSEECKSIAFYIIKVFEEEGVKASNLEELRRFIEDRMSKVKPYHIKKAKDLREKDNVK